MAHELYNKNDMLWYGKTPWHSLGIEMPELMSIGDIAATLDLGKVELAPAYAMVGDEFVPCPDQAVYITRNNKTTVIKSGVGAEYRTVQNEQALSLFIDVLGETTGAKRIETVGHLRGGARFWALAPLESWEVLGDLHQPYILLSNPHDSTGELRILTTSIRVVCANTEGAALSADKRKDLLRMRHSGNVDAKITALRAQARIATAEAYALRDVMTQIGAYEPTPESVDFVLTSLLGNPNESGRAKAQRERVTSLWENGLGNAPYAGTVYGLWNAYTELESHVNGSTGKAPLAEKLDTRANSLMFGSGRARIQNALSVFAEVWAPNTFGLAEAKF